MAQPLEKKKEMPRGGKREPDDFSPYKTADGRDLKLLKSSASNTGYQNIIKSHSGKISFVSTQDKGTTFSIVLPKKLD